MGDFEPPAGYAGVIPYPIVEGADEAIGWYQRALGAELVYRMEWKGKVGHAEFRLAGGHLMLADAFYELGHLGPLSRGGTTVSMLVHVPDVAAAHARALAKGATEVFPVEDKPWGNRSCQLADPFGHRRTLAQRVEDVGWDELDRRMGAAIGPG
jgi:PhnB protein